MDAILVTMNKMAFVFLLVISIFFDTAQARPPVNYDLQEGDLIFQNSECGALCHNINEVTPAIMGIHYAHIGLIIKEKDRFFVLEATGDEVQKTDLPSFLARTKQPALIGRLKKPFRHLIDSAVLFAESQIGVPYDNAFIYNNGKYYCAELIYDAFKAANGGKPLFEMQPMTFKQPGSKTFFPGWVRYYEQLQVDIPEGKPGCNPGSIGRSPYLELFPIDATIPSKQPAIEAAP